VLAAIFNAVMDSVGDGVAFRRSVFKKRNPNWWSKELSWQHVRFLPPTKYRPDAWHLAKSAMILCLVSAMVFYRPLVNWWADILILGTIWNGSFTLFYHRIFRK